MWYVCDDEFGLAFSEGYATEAEAEAELPKLQAWLREEHNVEQGFVVLFIEGE